MKKIIITLLIFCLVFSFTSCSSKANDPEKVDLMFDSFNNSEDYVLLTHFQLIVNGEHHERSAIKYNEKSTNIVFLDGSGFYSYTFNKQELYVEFLYTTYDSFTTTKIGEATLPADIINSFFGDKCFWFRTDDPSTDKFKQVHYCWSVEDKTGKIVDNVENNYEYSPDNNRTKDYTLTHHSGLINSYLQVVDNKTGTEKVIDKSVLETFDEGKEIITLKSSTCFSPEHAYVIDDDIYFVSGFGVGALAETHYYYIVKWNFNTEKCTFVAATRFDYFQEWVDDMIIIAE